MKKIVTLLAVGMIPATLSGCAACWPPGLCSSLCPCCPFSRTAACPPPTYAPMAATTAVCPPAAPTCVSWDPCQCAVVTQPQAAALTAAPAYAQPPLTWPQPPGIVQAPGTQPIYSQPTALTEPGCGYVEATCGAPFMGNVGYGPAFPIDYGTVAGDCCTTGEVVSPAPGAYADPRPVQE